MKIAFMRHTSPRVNSLGYPDEKLGPHGFKVLLKAKNITLPGGAFIEDGAMFHRTFLTDPATRKYIEKANIKAFIPCGGFKDTINHGNVRQFVSNFKELKFIVEGANVFFDDASRRYIAGSTGILQIKDSTANKGGNFFSRGRVLTGLFETIMKTAPGRQGHALGLIGYHDAGEHLCLADPYADRIHETNPEFPLSCRKNR
jgi:glutamate dehydrogenase